MGIIAASRLRGVINSFIFTVNSGANGEFVIKTLGDSYSYKVETSDGQNIVENTGDLTIVFPQLNNIYTVTINGIFPQFFLDNVSPNDQKLLSIEQFGTYGENSSSQIDAFSGALNLKINASESNSFKSTSNFNAAWEDCRSLTSFPLLDVSNGLRFNNTWKNCVSLTSFPLLDFSNADSFVDCWKSCQNLTSFPLVDVSSGVNFITSWNDCRGLTSFPLLDVSNGTNFLATWEDCRSLTSFPLLDLSSGINFSRAWRGCVSLTSFPLLDLSSGTNFDTSWRGCVSLTSFPLLDLSSGTNFDTSWRGCQNLTSFPLLDLSNSNSFSKTWRDCRNLTSFPSGFFNGCSATNFLKCFITTNLNQQSIDGILVSINSNTTSNGIFSQSGGSAPSTTGEAAITAMRNRGWTVAVTGGF